MMGSRRSLTVTGFWRSKGVFHAGLVHLLVMAISGATAGVAFAQNSPAPDPSLVAAQVKKFGVGKSVKIKLVDGEKLNGHIQSIAAEGFTVKLAKAGGERSIPYAQVAEIKDPGPLFWILVGATIVIVIIVAAKH
ncbi:MAG: hypothetical protein ABSF46_28645 [Terriglobia bacterium]|jgi:hypothetical protein